MGSLGSCSTPARTTEMGMSSLEVKRAASVDALRPGLHKSIYTLELLSLIIWV